MQRLLLQAHIQQRGNGDVGPALFVNQDGQEPTRYSHRRLHARVLKTIFGPIEIIRMGYCRAGSESIHPLDEALQLPARSFSYELQKRMVKAAVQGTFRETGERIAEITGAPVWVRSIEEVIQQAAEDFDAFYAERTPPTWTDTGSVLVAAVDGKGIPMIKPGGAQRAVRLTKGQKANRKKMATVAAVFTRAPWIRTPQQVVESLFGRNRSTRAGENPPPRPEHKRVWASLTKGKAALIGEVAAEVLRRDPQGHKIHVALTDGERALQILVSKKLKVTLILDLLHVLEKLWKAAYVFHAEGSPEAEQWVRRRAEKILEGHVSQVVQGIRQSVTKRALGPSKGKTLSRVANYLYRNRGRMHYDQYLAQGLPIGSGPVEGACKNLIKDRMERSGMRWTEAMAEAIVKLRAIYLSGDLDQYWPFHIQRDQERLHPAGRWSVVQK
ncbi:MAG: ISKra4 family transposase [Shimia sp.]|nr:ISKra4 family transposase [Shimia sp.]